MIIPDGPLCGCGQRGCLEAVSSGAAISRDATNANKAQITGSVESRDLTHVVTAGEAVALANAGYMGMEQVVDEAAR